MIEVLASLVVGAMVVEWWQTYHVDKPVPPAVTTRRPPPPLLPRLPRAVQLPPEVVAAPLPAPEAPRSAPAPRKPARSTLAVAVAAAPVADSQAVQPLPVADAESVAVPVPVVAPLPASDDALRSRAATAHSGGAALQAAADHAELLRRHPGDAEARRGLVQALLAAGLPELAVDVAAEDAGRFSAAEWAQLRGDVAARAVALAVRGEPRPERNLVLRARATDTLQLACEAADAAALATARVRCRSLRVDYLSGTGQHDDAVAAYAQGPDGLEDGAHAAAARSYLALSQPDAADAAWARRSTTAPATPDIAIDRLLVREELRDASVAIEARLAATPPFLSSADGQVRRRNWDRLLLEETRLDALAWRDRLPEAISGAEALLARAPADVGLRLQLARFHRYDGHPDRADAELEKAAALAPSSRAVLATRIAFATEDGEYQAARRQLAALAETWPASSESRDLRRAYDIARAARLEAFVGHTWSDGPGLVTTSEELRQEVTFYSPAWVRLSDTRAFVFEQGAVGDYAGETASPLRVGAGLLTRHRDWEARLSAHSRQGVVDHGSGATLAAAVRLGDHWRVDTELQSDSVDTPLLAQENGIEGWSAAAGIDWQLHAGHDYRLAARQLELSDDNAALTVSLTGRQPLYADAPHALSLLERLETTGHDLSNVPYFSPERMSAGELALEYRGVWWALGEGRWTHTVTLGAGASEQAGFGSDAIGDVRWAHEWRVNARLELGAGAEWRRRVYDGNAEDQTEFFATLLWRLP